VAARGPISNNTTIVDRATDMALLENMEAEKLRAPDSAPSPRKTRKVKEEWRPPP